MKIHQYGTVTFREGRGPLIEGWNVEKESTDPEDATSEQLLLIFAINWAKEKFTAAYNDAAFTVLREWSAKRAAIAKAAQQERTDA